LLTDAGLQAGIGYRTAVAPRVVRLIERWPDAVNVTIFLRRIKDEGLHEVLNWQHEEKPERIRRMAQLLSDEGVGRVDDLAQWVDLPDSRAKLVSLKGIKDKTADYVAILAGRPVAAVDRRLRTFVAESGVDVDSYRDVYQLLACVATKLDIDLGALDRAIWEEVEAGWTPAAASRDGATSDAEELGALKERLRQVVEERDKALQLLDQIRGLLEQPF
jgi:hypothetical protein